MLVKLFFSTVVFRTFSPELKTVRYLQRGGGACNMPLCFFPHTYCRIPLINDIAARRPLKLDILSALL